MAESSSTDMILRIFVSSPSDVADERRTTFEAIGRLPGNPLLPQEVAVKTVAWDLDGIGVPLAATTTPQDCINEGMGRPSECDIVLVIIGERIGSPLPKHFIRDDGTPYLSGTDWEFQDALNGHAQHGLPEVLVFRRDNLPPLTQADPQFQEKSKQRTLVEKWFKNEFHHTDGSWKRGYETYQSVEHFRQQIEKALAKQISLVIEKRKKGHRPGSTGELLVGQCKHCRHLHDDWQGRQYCTNAKCRNALTEPCLSCGTQNGVWHQSCAICGNDLQKLLDHQLEQLVEAEAEYQRLWKLGRYQEVLKSLRNIIKYKHPAIDGTHPWLEPLLKKCSQHFTQLQQQWSTAEQQANHCFVQTQYEQAIQHLDNIPEKYRSEQGSQLYENSQKRIAEGRQIEQQINDSANRQQWSTVRQCLVRLREIHPGHSQLKEFQQRLAIGLREQLLRDLNNHTLRREYLAERSSTMAQEDTNLGKQFESKLRLKEIITCIVVFPLLLTLPVRLRSIQRQNIPARFHTYGPLPQSAISMTEAKLDSTFG